MPKEKPNILVIMTDQLAAPALTAYGNSVVKAPNIQTMAEKGVVFDNAYCNSPLCAPSRASMLTGRLPSEIGAYDNFADFPSSIPTFLHYLRLSGYRTCLSGKMHMVGTDQLHGFEERLTTDIYPADFGWASDWERPVSRRFSWYHNMLSVVQAGPCHRTNQIDFDEEAAFHAVQWLYDVAREPQTSPFCMLVSFTHPHDPYAITHEYWDRYRQDEIDMPKVPPIPMSEQDPHSQRLAQVCAMDQYELTRERITNARRAYYGSISFIDDKIGTILKVLDNTGLKDNTIIILASDHGDMLGERGMWYKMSFFEWSARIPLIVYAPGSFSPGRVIDNVSLVDLFPTLVNIAESDVGADLVASLSGQSLLPYLQGEPAAGPDTVLGEYLAEGALAPYLMIKRGKYKFIWSEPDPDQLFDLEEDPDELNNLCNLEVYRPLAKEFRAEIAQRWDTAGLKEKIIASQRSRRLIYDAQMTGRPTPWDYQPHKEASSSYMRNTIKLDDLERRARFPLPAVPPTDNIKKG